MASKTPTPTPTKTQMVLNRETQTIKFRDPATGSDFFIDGNGVHADAATNEETKVDLCQHYLLYQLDRAGYDCRSYSKLLGGNNLASILSVVVEAELAKRENEGDVEAGLKSVYQMVGLLISTLQQRDKARALLKEGGGQAGEE